MKLTPVDLPIAHKENNQLFAAVIVSFVINLWVTGTIAHVFRTPGYSAVGTIRNLLPWALAINVASAGMLLFFRLQVSWQRRISLLVILDALASLLPLVLIRCLRFPDESTRLHLFGLFYAFFVVWKAGLLIWSLGLNAGRVSRNSERKCVFATSFLVYAAITPWVAFAALPTADEPHYLLVTHSLVTDHDLDISNNYRQGDYKTFYPADIPDAEHHSTRNSRGQELPVHDIGISVLLVPGYALAGRVGAMVELNVIAALLALGIYELALTIGTTGFGALGSWALFAFASPILVYSSQIYPEAVGGACSVWAVIAFLKFIQTKRNCYLASAGSLLACLPWLSVRYWVILGPVFSVILMYVVLLFWGDRIRALKALCVSLAPIVLSLALFVLFDKWLYGVALPNAGYFLLMRVFIVPMFTTTPQIALFGLFFDRAYGLLVTAPIYIIALAGIGILVQRKMWAASAILAPSIAYVLFAAFNRWWYGGWAPPSRYVFVAAALLAPVASLVIPQIARDLKGRLIATVLGIWSLLVASAYTAFPLTRYSFWDNGTGALSQFTHKYAGIDFGLMFPSFIRAGFSDYALAALWASVAGVCGWLLARTSVVPVDASYSSTSRG